MEVTEPQPHEPLSALLQKLLANSGDAPLNLGTILQQVGDKGFGLVLIILSLPSALPVPAPGYSTPFGILLGIFGFQMIIGKPSPAIPTRAENISLPKSMTETMLKVSGGFFRKVETFVRPRGTWITQGGGQRLLGVVVVIMSVLMMIPMPGTNTFPAMVICLTGIAMIEEDGLIAGLALIVGIAAVALYALLIYIAITQGPEAVESIYEGTKEWIKEKVL